MAWPPLLLCDDHTTVRTPEQWRSVRRPELRRKLQESVYGPWPPRPVTLEVHVLTEPQSALDGAATLHELQIVTTELATTYRRPRRRQAADH